jgi:hypothetical protein
MSRNAQSFFAKAVKGDEHTNDSGWQKARRRTIVMLIKSRFIFRIQVLS